MQVRRALILGLFGVLLLAGSLAFQLLRGGQERDVAPSSEPPAAAAPTGGAPPNTVASAAAANAATPSFDIVRVNPDGDAVIAGRAAPGATVTVLEDGRSIGQATADARGEWVLLPSQPLASGRRVLSLQVDRAGAPPLGADRVVTLDVPAAAPPEPRVTAIGAATAADRAVVEPGNSLWRLAQRRYGHGTEYGVIYQANRTQIRDPDLIYPGQVFVIPPER